MIFTHMSQEKKKKKKLIRTPAEVKMKISPVLDGAAAFLRNHVSANPKLIPERGEIEGDNVGERCVLNLSSPCVCVCVCVYVFSLCSSVCCWQRCDTLYTGAERRGRHRNCTSAAIGCEGNPTSVLLSCGLGGFI